MPSITPVPALTERDRAMTVLVVGGNGFIAGYLMAAMRQRGWRVLRGVRLHNGRALCDDERLCDFTTMTAPEQWRGALDGVDVVVNAAGILREIGRQTFDAIHIDGPLALASACVDAGVRRFVQISALGLPADGAFIASKHRLPPEYFRVMRWWFWLGWPAFLSVLAIFWLMVTKPM